MSGQVKNKIEKVAGLALRIGSWDRLSLRDGQSFER
jgi:hypothetical protein